VFHNGVVLNKFEEATYKNVEEIKSVFKDYEADGVAKKFKLTYVLINKKMDIKLFDAEGSNIFANAGPGTK